jgi:hypothetical protein
MDRGCPGGQGRRFAGPRPTGSARRPAGPSSQRLQTRYRISTVPRDIGSAHSLYSLPRARPRPSDIVRSREVVHAASCPTDRSHGPVPASGPNERLRPPGREKIELLSRNLFQEIDFLTDMLSPDHKKGLCKISSTLVNRMPEKIKETFREQEKTRF